MQILEIVQIQQLLLKDGWFIPDQASLFFDNWDWEKDMDI